MIAVNSTAPDPNSATSGNAYARRFDAGIQGGLGYRLGPALVQATYSLGLRTIPAKTFFNGVPVTSSDYYNRALQISLTYLFYGKSS